MADTFTDRKTDYLQLKKPIGPRENTIVWFGIQKKISKTP